MKVASNPYNKFIFTPLEDEKLKEAEKIIKDIMELKDKIIPYDNSLIPQETFRIGGMDLDSRRGKVEITNTRLSGGEYVSFATLEYDREAGLLKDMNVLMTDMSYKYTCLEGLSSQEIETEIYEIIDKKNHIKKQTIVDKKSGHMAFIEEEISA